METNQYRDLFITEAREIVTALNTALVTLEKKPEDRDQLNEIFRQAHTLKGMAATMNYEEITNLTHEMEEVFHFIRQGELWFDKVTMGILFECCDALSALINHIVRGAGEPGKQVKAKVQSLIEGLKSREKKRVEKKREVSRRSGFRSYGVSVSLRKDCPLKEARAVIVVKALEEMGTVVGAKELYEFLKRGTFENHFELSLATEHPSEEVKRKIQMIPDVERIVLESADSGQRTADRKPEEQDEKNLNANRSTLYAENSMVRVDLKRLDHLMNLVGELVINKIRLNKLGEEIANAPLLETLAQTARITDELQSEMMQARLIPLDSIFNRLPRTVRDLAILEEKEINLEIEGGEIGLDRVILDKINEPLVHLLRNAVSHGIESQAERIKQKKKEAGIIRVSSRREKNYVVIEISDDGRGLDPEEIKKVAIQKGILTAEEAQALSEEEMLMVITRPGFSTSKVVTQTAGRGVGMNAVRTAVESVGGNLKISSVPGQGVLFKLTLPLMLSILQALLVKVDEETYAIPMAHIIETMKVKNETVKRLEQREVIPYRESVLPLLRLGRSLRGAGTSFGAEAISEIASTSSGTSPRNDTRSSANWTRLPIVVIELGQRKAGLVVDDLLTQQEVVIKSTAGRLRTMKGVAGATILGDGRVAMVLDVGSVLKGNGK